MQTHEVYVSWSEAQANRDDRRTGVPWKVQYGKIGGGSDSLTTDANGQYESKLFFQSGQTNMWKNWDLTRLTQKWVINPATNFGALLWATNEDSNAMTLWFRSSEYSNSALWPVLEVIYSTTPKTVYFLKDHLGSIRATVLDSATAPVIGYDDYDAWGYPLAQRTKPIPNAYLQGASKIKFIGKEYDDEFGINWTWVDHRPFIPDIARWAVPDPAAEKSPGWSPYHYAFNNPIKYVDPNGKFPVLIIAAALAGALIADAIDANPANAPSPQDEAQGNVQQGKSDAQFAVEQGVGAGLGVLGGQLLGKAIGAITSRFGDEAGQAISKVANVADEAASAATKTPQLAKVLDGHKTGQGFSGAFDAASGKIQIRPSPNQRGGSIAEGGVPRGGGHLLISRELGGKASAHHGFTVILQKDGTLAVTWKSSSLNKTSNALVPEDLRPQIVKAIEEQTGKKVSSF